MRAAGLDIGSRSVELVVLDTSNGSVVSSAEVETTPNVSANCQRLLSEAWYDRLVVTGYGRAVAEVAFDAPSVTEIKAFACGAEACCPGCRTVLDIGGQDTKVIALDGAGQVTKFEMNDRCAAGAGRFLEVMAAALDYELPRFGTAALEGSDGVQLSSMCTVFAESEVIGLMTRGSRREDIAQAVHRAIIERTMGMLERVGAGPPLVFAGGAAKNACLVAFLTDALHRPVYVPDQPQMVGALGAAMLAAEQVSA